MIGLRDSSDEENDDCEEMFPFFFYLSCYLSILFVNCNFNKFCIYSASSCLFFNSIIISLKYYLTYIRILSRYIPVNRIF